MAFVKKSYQEKLVIDIDGPDGNAYALMGYADSIYKMLKKEGILEFRDIFLKEDEELITIDEIIAEMKSSDYENLLQVFNKYFGEYADLCSWTRGDDDDWD